VSSSIAEESFARKEFRGRKAKGKAHVQSKKTLVST